ncbi:MAG: hypothetical protein GTO40_28575 [Deltaproteobacteria bacterium]|nr:hypothetical protein [Deltaproteobacteria bacterium]
MALNRRFLLTWYLIVFGLGVLLNLSGGTLYGEVFPSSEMRYLSKLIDQYGKHAIIDRILKLRNGKITVEINGTFRVSTGRPQYSYITPRSLLKDIQSVGLSVRQFAKLILEAVREKQQQAKIEAEQKRTAELRAKAELAARAEKERKRAARRRAFFEQYGEAGNGSGSSDSDTYRVSKNSKRNPVPKTAVLKAGQIAAISEAYLDEAYQYLADDDLNALQVLLDAGNVYLMRQGIRVYVLDTRVERGRVKIRLEGTTIDLWAALASIQP